MSVSFMNKILLRFFFGSQKYTDGRHLQWLPTWYTNLNQFIASTGFKK